jgi:FkbM family methyltransferase
MMIGGRPISTVMASVVHGRNYRALINMFRVCPDPFDALRRYVSVSGAYPCTMRLRTPTGLVSPTLYSPSDMRTVNEIFCRKDYACEEQVKIVVDIGSNIGISALYFLTRYPSCTCYLYEPDPRNVQRLTHNLRAFQGRFVLTEAAVADRAGTFDFGIDETGRHGGLGINTGRSIKVRCLSINEVLAEVLQREGEIDLLKLDIEGAEEDTVAAIDEQYLRSIRVIHYESSTDADIVTLRPNGAEAGVRRAQSDSRIAVGQTIP